MVLTKNPYTDHIDEYPLEKFRQLRKSHFTYFIAGFKQGISYVRFSENDKHLAIGKYFVITLIRLPNWRSKDL